MLNPDDKLGMSLDDIIRYNRGRRPSFSGNGRGRFWNKGGQRNLVSSSSYGRRRKIFPVSNRRQRMYSTQTFARSNAKSSTSIIGSNPYAQRIYQREPRYYRGGVPQRDRAELEPVAVGRDWANGANEIRTVQITSLTTPQFRARQRRRNAIVALARRLVRRRNGLLQMARRRGPNGESRSFALRRGGNPLDRQGMGAADEANGRTGFGPSRAFRQRQPAVGRGVAERVRLLRPGGQTSRAPPYVDDRIDDRFSQRTARSPPSTRRTGFDGERRFVSRQLAEVSSDRQFERRRRFAANSRRATQRDFFDLPTNRNSRRTNMEYIEIENARNGGRRRHVLDDLNVQLDRYAEMGVVGSSDRFAAEANDDDLRMGSLYADGIPYARRNRILSQTENRRQRRRDVGRRPMRREYVDYDDYNDEEMSEHVYNQRRRLF